MVVKLCLAFLLFSHLSQGPRYILVVIGAFAFTPFTLCLRLGPIALVIVGGGGSVNALQFSQFLWGMDRWSKGHAEPVICCAVETV